MKNLIALLLCLTLAFQAQAQENFGKKINEKSAIEASQLPAKMGDKESMNTKVTGTVESVCQAKGCWMKVKMDNGETMRVTFKDYGFFVPKDIAGKTVVVEGLAQKKTTPVSELRHYAEDAGKSKAEIAAITDSKNELAFVADGVIVK
ncbi:DUF4920 domain-containing protein [Persicitalea jodogahamensis]|uniref:DUF4920 domain-containing protein n=1 Tax=Persicitalea jodogahamensis TaxID=402147 RepID=A0A8J3D1R8_9BACT|nr:DUF4920 domain-containing protein [Persicitalea jodogahamensis]GHB57955.1 hypothetical protein GCM10007390_09250 [Persicitalea jodogahamensis]